MNEHDLKITIEATLLAAGRPVPTQQLLELFDERERPTKEQLQAALDALAQDYADRGIELVEVASGWRIQVRQRCIDTVSRLWQERPTKYSRALLETLALVAYRQPITRSEIEEIRGVSVSSTIMRTLQERNWIRVVGHREVPGRPELLGTTREFLDYFGLKSLDQLPTLAELRDVETIGVQLELPAGEPEPASSEGDDTSGAQDAASSAEATVSEETGTEGSSGEEAAPGEISAAADTAEEAAEPSEDEETTAESNQDDPELSADADEQDDEEVTPTLVAAEADAEERRIGEPPRDRD
jgi:segregation and condensation protein B